MLCFKHTQLLKLLFIVKCSMTPTVHKVKIYNSLFKKILINLFEK